MDIQNVIFNAARDGRLLRLKAFLDIRCRNDVKMLVNEPTNGATPLVMACRNGHQDVVEYLVDVCKARIEEPGSVVFDGETIEGAPPLWCAAAAGHLSVVRFLVKRGANINSTTRTNSTPLRAACFDGHFEIVKFLIAHGADIEVSNRHGHTCLMIACYKGHYKIAQFLLSLGANVNAKSVKGNTALHDCAETGSLDILKMLLANGATMDVDSYGMTPLLAASVTGHTHIVEYLIQYPNLISRKESIDALELLGATYIDKKRDMFGALELWKRAMYIRYEEYLPSIPKPPQPKTNEAYEHAKEIRSLDELDDLLADPDEMRMQALLIRERILGPAHPDTSYYIRYRGAVYADSGKFSRCITLWTYALDMQQQMLEPLNPMTQSSLFSFTELFTFMIGEDGRANSRGRRARPVTFDEIMIVLRKAIHELVSATEEKHKDNVLKEVDPNHLHRVLCITLHLACLLGRLEPDLTSEQRYAAHRLLYLLVSIKVRGIDGQTPLHIVCNSDATIIGRYPACRFPSPNLVKMLLTVGADPNEKDKSGNLPLHFAGKSGPFTSANNVIQVLLDHGAHIDAVDSEGNTFSTYLNKSSVNINPLKYTKLSCLAAKVIRRNNIPYEGVIPTTLIDFVSIH